MDHPPVAPSPTPTVRSIRSIHQDPPPVEHQEPERVSTPVDQNNLLQSNNNEEESFALAPVDASVLKGKRQDIFKELTVEYFHLSRIYEDETEKKANRRRSEKHIRRGDEKSVVGYKRYRNHFGSGAPDQETDALEGDRWCGEAVCSSC